MILRAREREGMKRGLKLAKHREIHALEHRSREIVTNMPGKNLSDEMIADFACVSLEYIRKVKSERMKNNVNK
ncbi:MAG: hypothetical protein LBR52_05795 [Prevotellaceae bacterium]|jgi:hypothetical protein|nr:hypothetical protein [Prevotellaceae bacterium]